MSLLLSFFSYPKEAEKPGLLPSVTSVAEINVESTTSLMRYSMEPETILDLCDRVLVFSRGQIMHEIKDAATSKSKLMELT